MKDTTSRTLIYILTSVILVGITAGATAYITKTPEAPSVPVVKEEERPRHHEQHAQQQVPQQPVKCGSNVLGTVAGAAAGGLAGDALGRGRNKGIAALGGALGGAYLGNQYIAPDSGCK